MNNLLTATIPSQTVFRAIATALAILFISYGMDVRRKRETVNLAAPLWQLLMKGAAALLVGSFAALVWTITSPDRLDWVALIVGACGTALVVAAKRALGSSHTFTGQCRAHPRLVTTGIYSITRNPLYLGVFICEAGALLCALHTVPDVLPHHDVAVLTVLCTALAYAVSFNWTMARREARQLELRCGDAYRAYAARVPFLFPLRTARS